MENSELKILLVEDDNVARLMETKTIQSLHCHIDAAKNGEEALKLVRQNHYDIIFMDLMLPDTDGLTLTQAIRAIEARNQTVPIIALTSHGENEYQNQATWVGMDGFLTKPLTNEKCQRALQSFVRRTDKL